MSILTAGKRNKLPKSSFGLPGSKKFPMPDKAHAANAKARATQQVNKGNLSEESKKKIDSKANKILGTGLPGSRLAPIPVDGLCVRIGAMRCHSQGLTIKLREDLPLARIESLLDARLPLYRETAHLRFRSPARNPRRLASSVLAHPALAPLLPASANI